MGGGGEGRGGGGGGTRRKPPDNELQKCHILEPENSKPQRSVMIIGLGDSEDFVIL